ncbi:MAG: phosphotransferase family protein [Pseudomonadota bacterium]
MSESIAGLEARIGAIGPYLEKAVSGFEGLERVEKFADGQSNPTFKLGAVSGDYVLRCKPPGALLKSAHAVDREFRVLQALAGSAVPVPSVYHLCQDEAVIGSIFYVMDFVQGRTFWDPRLPELSPSDRADVYDEMNRVLAAIHGLDLAAVGLSDYGRPGNYFARQYDRWTRQYRASATEPVPVMEDVIAWLAANMVSDDGRIALVHGDYRLDNIMFASQGPNALAVMDWELSTLGHPFADLGYQCALWHMPPGGFLSGFGDQDRTELGIPSEEDYVARYCQRLGLDAPRNWSFYLVFGLFRLAAIAQGVKKRALDGNASSARALEVGALVAPLAEKACGLAHRKIGN